jgi:hypothetical protein
MNLPNLTVVMNLIRCLIREPATEFTSRMETYLLAKLDDVLEDYKKEHSAYQHYVYKQRLLNFIEEERDYINKKPHQERSALLRQESAIPLNAISTPLIGNGLHSRDTPVVDLESNLNQMTP